MTIVELIRCQKTKINKLIDSYNAVQKEYELKKKLHQTRKHLKAQFAIFEEQISKEKAALALLEKAYLETEVHEANKNENTNGEEENSTEKLGKAVSLNNLDTIYKNTNSLNSPCGSENNLNNSNNSLNEIDLTLSDETVEKIVIMARRDDDEVCKVFDNTFKGTFDGSPEGLPAVLNTLKVLKLRIPNVGNQELLVALLATRFTGKAALATTGAASITDIENRLQAKCRGEKSSEIKSRLVNQKLHGQSRLEFEKSLLDLTNKLEAAYIGEGIPAEKSAELVVQEAAGLMRNIYKTNTGLVANFNNNFSTVGEIVEKFNIIEKQKDEHKAQVFALRKGKNNKNNKNHNDKKYDKKFDKKYEKKDNKTKKVYATVEVEDEGTSNSSSKN